MIFDGYLLLIVIILGVVEGLTEFLPISSSCHVVFIGDLLGLGDNSRIKFLLNVVIQLGAVFSVVVIFWKEFCVLLSKMIHNGGSFICFSRSRLCCGHIILGILPTLILGLIFYENIKSIFQIRYMFYSLITGGILLLISDVCSDKFYISNTVSNINNITYWQAFLVGCFQCLALCPGFSRSGATISGGLLVGMNRYVSSIFSFLLAIPIMFSATVLACYKNLYVFVWEDLLFFIVGFFVSFIVSLLTVKVFIRILQSVTFFSFAIYRFILAFFLYSFGYV